MNDIHLRFSLRHLLVLGGLVAGGALFTACAVDPDESSPADEETAVAESPLPNCCEKVGYAVCPDNGNDWVCFPLGYCGPLKSTALANCNANCDAACVFEGWYNECL